MSKWLTEIPRIALGLPTAVATMSEMLRGILAYAHLNGPWAIQIIGGRAGEQAIAPPSHANAYSGLIVYMGDNIGSGFYQPWMDTSPIPMVLAHLSDDFIASGHPLAKKSRVMCDNRSVALAAADYLAGTGRGTFAYIGEVHNISWSEERARIFTGRLAAQGRQCAIYPAVPEAEQDHFLIEQKRLSAWLRTLPKPAAIFAANDTRALQTLDACLAAGLRVPEEVAILGVDNDVMICETAVPPLSSIQMDNYHAGYEAAALLDALMHGRRRRRQIIRYGFSAIVPRRSTDPLPAKDWLAASALDLIRINSGNGLTIPGLAAHLRVSRRLLEMRFKAATGRTLYQAMLDIRLERARSFLRQSLVPIEQIAATCGFSSPSHLSACFRRRYGLTPSECRRGKDSQKE